MAERIPEYDELKLRIERGSEGGYRVLAFGPDGTTATGEFAPPFSAMELDNFILRVGRPRRSVRAHRSSHMQEAKEFGSTLFDALLQDDVREAYLGARRVAEAHDRGLRVTLYLTGVPELMEIPWEFLYERPSFLAQSIYTPVVRSLDLKNVRQPGKLSPPLQILGMVSTPNGYEGLDVDEEQRKLEQALSSLSDAGLVELRWLPRATMEELNRTIAAPDDVHVLHYIGHGAYDQKTEAGILVLENSRGDPYEISGEELGTLLYDEHSMRLAVLNSCEGARTSHVEPFSGVASRLVECGVPAVVGMQFEITDDAAITFSERFYTSLAQGFPVDAALAQARKAIFAAGSDIEFGTPVLFLRGADARLFDIEQAPTLPKESTVAGPADFSVSLEQRPPEARPGEHVTWELTIENTGACPLQAVAATASDGRALAELGDLDVGRRGLIRWRDVVEPGVRQLVTVTASDPEGSRISEQVVAHSGGADEPPPASLAGNGRDERRQSADPPGATQAGIDGPAPRSPEHGVVSQPAAPTTARPGSSARLLVGLAGVLLVAIVAAVLAALGAFSGDEDGPEPPLGGSAIEAGGTVGALAARGDAIVWERKVPGGWRLRVMEGGNTVDIPGPPVWNIAGVDVGIHASGREVAIYSRCPRKNNCDIYRYELGPGGDPEIELAERGCFLFGPSIKGGVISASRGIDASEGGQCQAGVYVGVRGERSYDIPVSRPTGTNTDGRLVAWSTADQRKLTLAKVGSSRTRPVDAPGDHLFDSPRLDGDYLYFVDSPDGETYVIARTKRRGPSAFEHYGPGLSFEEKPTFAVTDGMLVYSGDAASNPDDGKDKIWRDRAPRFRQGLADAH